jgi:protein kinase A
VGPCRPQFGHFQDDHVLCLVTEFAAVDFFNQMTNHFGTGAYWSSVKIYAAQTLLGLEAMHKKRLLYRDLKPENMLVRTDGTLLIADFGMSIILKVRLALCCMSRQPSRQHALTPRAVCDPPQDGEKAHSICGTAEYMSPEMVEHSGYRCVTTLSSLPLPYRQRKDLSLVGLWTNRGSGGGSLTRPFHDARRFPSPGL